VTASAGRAARRIREFLTESLGDPVEIGLFEGFLVATGAALLRGGQALVRDPAGPGGLLVAEFADGPPLSVPVIVAGDLTGLDTGLSAVLAACARHHRRTNDGRPPWMGDLLADLAGAARDIVVDPDRRPLRLRELRLHRVAGPPVDAPDWRSTAAVLLTVARLGLPELAPLAADAPLPRVADGLRDQDCRVLLALRDVALARARGVRLELPRHHDPVIAAARSRLVADIEAVLDGNGLPGPDSPAFLLTALVDPESAWRSGIAPVQWRSWLTAP
jgi:hypothetical protein